MKIIIILAILLTAAFVGLIPAAQQTATHTFRCKSCDSEFKPEWKSLLFASHSDDVYNICCPKCGKKGCRILKNTKFPENT